MISYLLEQVDEPATEPVSLAEAKMAARVLHDDEDDLFTHLIAAATGLVDGPFGYLGQAIITQSWRVSYPQGAVNGNAALALPFGPVASIVSIKTYDGTTLSDDIKADFDLFKDRFNARIKPKTGNNWPALADREDALQIEYIAGEDAAKASIKHALLMIIAHWYENRETVLVGSITKEIEYGALALLQNERRGFL